MDFDTVADELYGLRPEEFTAARDAHAAAARKAGDRDLAQRIAGLRRPSRSAWAGNLLVRRSPEEVEALLRLGESLRRAYQDLDRERLRELTGGRRALVGALSRQAGQFAAEQGHPISETARQEVEATLRAVLADARAAEEWSVGRLTKPLDAAVGFPAVDEGAVRRTASAPPQEPAPARPASASAPARPASASASARTASASAPARSGPTPRKGGSSGDGDGDRDRDGRGGRLLRAAEEKRRDRQARARQDAEDAGRELRDAETAAKTAGQEAADAKEHAEGLQRRIKALAAELLSTEEAHRTARAAERRARERVREADRQVREAGRRARTATARVEALKKRDG
ncbi:hypothetical protein ACIQAC_32165 [Streptomyces sp. NPDC088387]|uniref:hypothetical protein n=1 Tax=Streptomyces sp. NPDC088387 TaxID=3365859 RepID=UPI00382A4AE7